MQTYSYSKFNLFGKCPRAYKLKYIDRVKVEKPQTAEQFTGKKVHEALEFLYSEIMKKKIPSIAYLLTKFDIDWRKTFNTEKLIVNSTESFHNKATTCIENYYNQHYPFAGDRTVAVEQKVTKNLDNFAIEGYVDRIEKKEGKYVIHDYKTAKVKDFDVLQMQIYHLCLDAAKEADCIWHFVYLNDSEAHHSVLNNFENHLYEKVNKIEKEKEFEKKISNNCKWCEFKENCLATL